MLARFASIVPAAMIAASASAQLHNADIILSLNQSTMQTGVVDPATLQVSAERVFGAAFGSFDSTSNPGFDSAPGSLPPGASVGFDILSPLAVWDGARFWSSTSEPGYPGTLPNPLPRLRARLGPLNAFSPTNPQVVPGFGFAVDPDGVYHHHLTFTLFSQATPAASPAEAGIYALQLRMWCSAPAVAPSEPFWIVFNQLASVGDQQAAIDALRILLAPPACQADFNTDGDVNPDDLGDYITCYFSIPPCAQADFNADGDINPDDLGDFITVYFTGC